MANSEALELLKNREAFLNRLQTGRIILLDRYRLQHNAGNSFHHEAYCFTLKVSPPANRASKARLKAAASALSITIKSLSCRLSRTLKVRAEGRYV